MRACVNLRLSKAGARWELARVRRPGYVYGELLAAHDASILPPTAGSQSVGMSVSRLRTIVASAGAASPKLLPMRA
jgi:hypothetical protein